jgi:hypothetical protein
MILAPWTYLSLPITHPPLPLPSLFLAFGLPGSREMHVLTSPHVYTILSYLNITYSIAF